MEEVSPDPEAPASTDTFREVFGVSTDELERNGIDVSDYVRKNWKKAARSEKRMAAVWASQPQSSEVRHQSLIWGQRAFYLMFLTLGILILSTFASGPLRFVLIGLAVVTFCAVCALVAKYFMLMSRYRKLRKVEARYR